ncbi:polyadenylate-binding protein-interacting protein 11-like isoform X2 [Tripterygium wilfordii]|uniref:polyadenylate-binding protein-interacting protein 11-like isoform X2 n=1 Tax=Tripterygium wilfordii TaxID=458696 RepID=UPI0018F84605|nr:polyadenylate-binding protein-interacting protein 11-like isoform X2 [Tripterygium wilfordii]
MAVVENGDSGVSVGSSSIQESTVVVGNDQNQLKPGHHVRSRIDPNDKLNGNGNENGSGGGDDVPILRTHHDQQPSSNIPPHMAQGGHQRSDSGGSEVQRNGDVDAVERFNRDMMELQELFSKLNPMAEEFVPPSLTNGYGGLNGFASHGLNGGFYTNNALNGGDGLDNGINGRRKNFGQGKRRMNSRTSHAQREEVIRRTVYVSDIDQLVTEEQLAALFVNCGQVVDCRICGDPNSVLRFAFIEFTDEEGARSALNLSGTMLGFYPVRVLPSKTAIAPVNPTFLPRTEDERETCARTIYCTNIDKKVTQADVKLFFESVCGEVYRLRLLGDYHHSTRIAFVEFVMAESAIAALNCSGVVLGSLPIRVSPSKTPVRPRAPRLPSH